jgi:hypothetical protein
MYNNLKMGVSGYVCRVCIVCVRRMRVSITGDCICVHVFIVFIQ